MQFHDLQAQYQALKADIDAGMAEVLAKGQFILGPQVQQLEKEKEELAAEAQQLQESLDLLRSGQAEDSDEAYYLEVYDELTEGLNKVKEYLAGH